MYGQGSGEGIPRSRGVASSSRSSASTTAASPPTSDNSSVPSQLEIKNLFKSLCRKYLRTRQPPTQKEMEPLWKCRDHLDFEDMSDGETKWGSSEESYTMMGRSYSTGSPMHLMTKSSESSMHNLIDSLGLHMLEPSIIPRGYTMALKVSTPLLN